MARRRGCVLASLFALAGVLVIPSTSRADVDWHVLLQVCELQNQQPDQGKKPDGAPRTVPREVGRPRSCVKGSSTEVGPERPASSSRSTRGPPRPASGRPQEAAGEAAGQAAARHRVERAHC
jgi:hypothetical protein